MYDKITFFFLSFAYTGYPEDTPGSLPTRLLLRVESPRYLHGAPCLFLWFIPFFVF